MGASPAIVLRGYGGDEEAVHARLNPRISVIVSADRRIGVASAAARGADVAVLDDAFQHRRVHRIADLVLVSADAWRPPARLLPAGPFREPLGALSRASIIVVTRKAADIGMAEAVRAAASRAAPNVPTAVIALQPRSLVRSDGGREVALDTITGERVRAIAAIGNPGAFARQLAARGADVSLARFPDHHAYTMSDAEQLARDLPAGAWPVCTLKDLVKLAPLWPRAAPPLWYVSQDVIVEQGEDALDALLTAVLRARHREP
jgi:tetraacyldisaccharide 4'-kinase